MIKIYKKENHGKSNLGWLQSLFHFSFAEYRNNQRIHYGNLRVINDDLILAGTGFDMHPHNDMEIISYVVDGELTHQDSMGNKHSIGRGNIQYMSAGTGIFHSEHNLGKTVTRLLQIWIYPDKKGCKPSYGDHEFSWNQRKNKLLHMVSPLDGNAPVKIHQNANLYSLELTKDNEITFNLQPGWEVYAVQIEGNSVVNSLDFNERDGLESNENLHVKAKSTSHMLFIELKKEK